jgi:hypothetical protein
MGGVTGLQVGNLDPSTLGGRFVLRNCTVRDLQTGILIGLGTGGTLEATGSTFRNLTNGGVIHADVGQDTFGGIAPLVIDVSATRQPRRT